MRFPWNRPAKPVTTEVSIREPVDRVARRVLAPWRQDFMSRADLRQRRDSFEGKLQELQSGARIQIPANDRKQIQKIFAVLAATYPKMNETDAISFASWVLDLRPSTVEVFFREWLAQYEKVEKQIKDSGVRFRVDAPDGCEFLALSRRLEAIENDEDVILDYGLNHRLRLLELARESRLTDRKPTNPN